MPYKISILDLLKIDKDILESKRSDFAIYSGIPEQNIPKGTIFRTIYDSKEPGNNINGEFKIEQIVDMNREVDNILKGYHAVLFISSNITLENIISRIETNENGNFKNLCYLSTE